MLSGSALQRRRPKLQRRRCKGAGLSRDLPLAKYPVGEGLLHRQRVARTSQLQRRRLSRDLPLGESGTRLAISRPRQFLRRGRMLRDYLVLRLSRTSHSSYQDSMNQRKHRVLQCQRQMRNSRSEEIAGSSATRRWTRRTGRRAKARTSGTPAVDVSVGSAECT